LTVLICPFGSFPLFTLVQAPSGGRSAIFFFSSCAALSVTNVRWRQGICIVNRVAFFIGSSFKRRIVDVFKRIVLDSLAPPCDFVIGPSNGSCSSYWDDACQLLKMFPCSWKIKTKAATSFFPPRDQLVAIKLNGPPGAAALLCGRLLFTIVYLWTFFPATPRAMINI